MSQNTPSVTGSAERIAAAARRAPVAAQVASPDASGCVAAPGFYFTNATGGAVDASGTAMGRKCNVVGAALATLPGQTACACMPGYMGTSCESCAHGFLPTPVLLGDGVHSLSAVAEILRPDDTTSQASGMHTDEYLASKFDYTDDYAVRGRRRVWRCRML